MNKRKVDALIPGAYKVLQEVCIAENGKIKRAWRGQISTFGAAIATGSLLAAVSFFSKQQGAAVPREKLLQAIGKLLEMNTGSLFDEVKKLQGMALIQKKEEILEAAVALKLAMNLYELEDS